MSSHCISHLRAREILDSRATPTLEVSLTLENGTEAHASVPSGASKGRREAFELRDGDPKRYNGQGVLKSIALVEGEIASLVLGMDACDQAELDSALCALDSAALDSAVLDSATLDSAALDSAALDSAESAASSSPPKAHLKNHLKSPLKSHLGTQACLAVSLACARVAAVSLGIPLYRHIGGIEARTLPVPLMNVLNGGAHAANTLAVQEFMLVPLGAPSFVEALRMGTECYTALKDLLETQGVACGLGDEGGFAPPLRTTQEALDFLMQAIDKAGLKAGKEMALALDCAASGYFEQRAGKEGYALDGAFHESDSYAALLKGWVEDYPIVSLEDPLAEEDWKGWRAATEALGEKIQLVGDDLFVSQEEPLRRGFAEGVANALLLKPNQVGTLSQAMACGRLAMSRGWGCVVSHRSGETEDSFIADLAVGMNCGQIKTGAPARSERVAKYNRLLRIHEQLGKEARYGGVFVSGLLSRHSDKNSSKNSSKNLSKPSS